MKVNEIFFSIQGEGIYIGVPMAFVRFTGCNLRCKWCDTKYAWDEGKEMTMDEIIENVKDFPTKWVCLTGGEPLLQKDIYKLIDKFLSLEYKIIVETNGSISIENIPCEENVIVDLDIKTPSSGMSQFNDFSNLELLGTKDYVKFVIEDDVDYNYMKDILKSYEFNCDIILQPEGNKNLKDLAEKVLKDGLNVRVLPQLHKIIWGDKRGV
ncbi:MAG: 7-carboxy-7-deazaguanine synthase QueE [Thermoplasmata archaeon]|nr:radical SAM protein [Thermoplasmata archaeon]